MPDSRTEPREILGYGIFGFSISLITAVVAGRGIFDISYLIDDFIEGRTYLFSFLAPVVLPVDDYSPDYNRYQGNEASVFGQAFQNFP